KGRRNGDRGKKKAPVSRGCVEVGFFVVGMTDATRKRHVVSELKIFFLRRATSFPAVLRLAAGGGSGYARRQFQADLRGGCWRARGRGLVHEHYPATGAVRGRPGRRARGFWGEHRRRAVRADGWPA